MRTTTVSGRPSPSTSPDTRGSASVVVTFVADPGAASRSARPFTNAMVSRSIVNVAFDGSGGTTGDATPDAAVPVGAQAAITTRATARMRTLRSVLFMRSTFLAPAASFWYLRTDPCARSTPPRSSLRRPQHGVQRRGDALDRLNAFPPTHSPAGDDRDRVGLTCSRPDDPGAVHTPALFSRIPPVLQRNPVTACHIGPRRDAPTLRWHDRTQHAYRERTRRRIEDLATQQLREDRCHRASRREAR